MAESKDNDRKARPESSRRKSTLHRVISAVITAFFLGMLLLVAVNSYVWNNDGYEVMMQKLDQNYQAQVNSLEFRNRTVAAYSIALFQLMNEKFLIWILRSKQAIQTLETSKQLSFLKEAQDKGNSNFVGDIFSGITGNVKRIGCMVWASFVVLLFKFINVFSAILLYLFASLLGALDGFLARYVRTAEGGRESTFVFHRMTDVIIQLPVWLMVIYLVSPIFINPVIMIALLALSFFMVFNIATASLKKFL